MFLLRTRLGMIAGAAALAAAIVLPASTAAAAPAQRDAPAQSACLFSEGYYCYLQNGLGYYIAGDTHGDTIGTDSVNGTRYLYTAIETVNGLTYGEISNTAGTLCWNYASGFVYMDSCNGDNNELYAMVPCSGGSWCISSYDIGPLYLLNGGYASSPLYFEGGSPTSASEWVSLTSI